MPCTIQVDRGLFSMPRTNSFTDTLLLDRAFSATGVTASNSVSSKILSPSRIQNRIASWSVISNTVEVALISFNKESEMRIGMGLDGINEIYLILIKMLKRYFRYH